MLTVKLEHGKLVATESRAEEITLAEWREGARPEAGSFALVIPNDVELDDLAEAVRAFDTIILEFPAFGDGRAYSQARILRERFGFSGVLRARGDVLRDQALFMRRAGFDAFEIASAAIDGFAEAFDEFSAFYQIASDATAPVWRLRASRADAA